MHSGRCNDCALSRSFARLAADFDSAVVIAKITCHGTSVARDRSMSSLVVMYVRLAHKEEREVGAERGARWDAYAAHTPRWIPRLRAHSQNPQPH